MENKSIKYKHFPGKQGLYDPHFEHDSCGVGFVCNIKGKKDNHIVKQGLEVLRRLAHRGATGADPKTGDGAGILIQFPHDFFVSVCAKERIELPKEGEYGSGIVFLPTDKLERQFCKEAFIQAVHSAKQSCLGWRSVPVDNSEIGISAKETQPVIEQIFIGRSTSSSDPLDFERKLYIIRKHTENIIRNSKISQKSFFYITNLSSRTFIYKGLLMPHQVFAMSTSARLKKIMKLKIFACMNLMMPIDYSRFEAQHPVVLIIRACGFWMMSLKHASKKLNKLTLSTPYIQHKLSPTQFLVWSLKSHPKF